MLFRSHAEDLLEHSLNPFTTVVTSPAAFFRLRLPALLTALATALLLPGCLMGTSTYSEDAINELFNDAYPKALSDLNLTPIARPQVEFDKLEKDKDFSARISVEIRPDFEVKDYKGVKIEKVDRKMTDENRRQIGRASCRERV